MSLHRWEVCTQEAGGLPKFLPGALGSKTGRRAHPCSLRHQVILHPPLGPVSGQLVLCDLLQVEHSDLGRRAADTATGSPLHTQRVLSLRGLVRGLLRGLWRGRLGELMSHMACATQRTQEEAGWGHRCPSQVHSPDTPVPQEERASPQGRCLRNECPGCGHSPGLCALSARGSHGLLLSGRACHSGCRGRMGSPLRRVAFRSVADGTGSP